MYFPHLNFLDNLLFIQIYTDLLIARALRVELSPSNYLLFDSVEGRSGKITLYWLRTMASLRRILRWVYLLSFSMLLLINWLIINLHCPGIIRFIDFVLYGVFEWATLKEKTREGGFNLFQHTTSTCTWETTKQILSFCSVLCIRPA